MQTCDRCPQPIVVRWWHPETKAEIGACQHHSNEWYPVLHEQGWLMADLRHELPPVTADPSTH